MAKEVKEAEVVKEVKKSSRKDSAKIAKDQAKKAEVSAKAKLTVKDLREMSKKDLAAKLAESRNDLNDFHKMARTNELPSSHVIKKTRREIARIRTILTEKKLAEELTKEAENE